MPIKYSKSASRDWKTGFSLNGDVLSSERQILKVDEKETSNPEFMVGKEIHCIFYGVIGFEPRNDKVFLGATISVIDEHGVEAMSRDDLFTFTDENGVDPVDAETITLALKVGPPIFGGGEYTWKMRIWDKVGSGELVAELKFKAVYPVELLKGQNAGLSSTGQGLFVDGELLTRPEIKMGQVVKCIITGLTGFTPRDGRVYLGSSFSVLDVSGNEVFSTGDLFENEDSDGNNPADVSIITQSLTTGKPFKSGESYQWTVRLWDKVSSNEMSTTVDLLLLKNEISLEIESHGLESLDQAFIVDGAWVSDLNVKKEQQIKCCFFNMEGFTEKNGRIFPGADISILDLDATLLEQTKDMFEDEEEGLDASTTNTINLSFSTCDPFDSGKQYIVVWHIWDKVQDAELLARAKLNIKTA